MFEKLQQKWKVGGLQVFVILCTFAIGGSLTGYLGRKLMGWMGLHDQWYFLPLYIVVVTLLWPFMVLLVSIPFGQFKFFTAYLARIGRKMGLVDKNKSETTEYQSIKKTRIAIFASGAGSNAREIIQHFESHPHIEVGCLACNKPGAGAIQIAQDHRVPVMMIEKERFFRGDGHVHELKGLGIDFIVLAGFLWKVPESLIAAFPQKIVNIHPALLPKYGGKGMYGSYVHEAVIANRETESGITIHFVDAQYDHGKHIFQATCPIDPSDTPTDLAKKVHALEHQYFPTILEKTILDMQKQG